MLVEVVPATQVHVAMVGPNLREADREEVIASGLWNWAAAVRISVGLSCESWAGVVDGVPVCVFGISAGSEMSNSAVPWLLATCDMERYQWPFLRRNKSMVESWLSRYDLLENYVDCRNTVSQRWLRWLGFDLCETVPRGPNAMPFIRFEKRRVR
jgi:hypothetical protein